MDEFFNRYFDLCLEIDKEISKLELMHDSQLNCKKGCSSCCESIKIFPIEFYAIKSKVEIKRHPKLKLKHKFSSKCRFLINDACILYNYRPIICRTQGLPLLYETNSGNTFELSVCKLNFKGLRVDSFNMRNALFMAPFNSKLFLLNKEFVENFNIRTYKPTDRLKLNIL